MTVHGQKRRLYFQDEQWSDLKGGSLVRVQSAYNSLLPTERQVADYILQNKEKISDISIQNLTLQAADISLYGTTNIKSIITGTIEPRTAQMCVVDSLFMVIIHIKQEQGFKKPEKNQPGN